MQITAVAIVVVINSGCYLSTAVIFHNQLNGYSEGIYFVMLAVDEQVALMNSS